MHLSLIGDGDMRATVESEIARLRLERHVEILGWKSEQEIIDELDSTDIFVLPSFAEGLPVVIMEALAREVPVISTYVAGIPELVQSGKTGWLVSAGDPHALSNCMVTALNTSAQEKKKLGSCGRQKIISEFGPSEPLKLINIFTGNQATSIGSCGVSE